MGFHCGIVGLPNAGKSTLFNALTRAGVAAENYPFCTVESNLGAVPVPDPRLAQLAALVNPAQVVPAQMHFVDIAGLVKGSSAGEGLGNRFLARVRETQAIAQVVRCFEDETISHVENRIDPLADIEIIETELCLADLETVERSLNKLSRLSAATGDKQARRRTQALMVLRDQLNQVSPLRLHRANADQQAEIDALQLLTGKPLLYAANVSERHLQGGYPGEAALRARARSEGVPLLGFCALAEAEVAEFSEADQGEFLSMLGLEASGLDRLIRSGYDLLGLHTFFTAGPKELRAWTLPKGMTALRAAGVIHSDFERGFIRAEVTALTDYLQCKGETSAKALGKCRLEGRDYVVQDGDVIHFRCNT